MRISSVFASAAIALLLNSVSYASQPVFKGFYLGGGLSYGQTALNRPAVATSFTRDGFAWTAFAGYQFYANLAAEAGYVDMQNVKAAGTISRVPVHDTVKPFFVYVAMKGILPIQDHLSLFAKVGGAYADGKESLRLAGAAPIHRSKHAIVAYGALGTNYAINSNLSLDAEVSTTLKHDMLPRMTVGTLGLMYTLPITTSPQKCQRQTLKGKQQANQP